MYSRDSAAQERDFKHGRRMQLQIEILARHVATLCARQVLTRTNVEVDVNQEFM